MRIALLLPLHSLSLNAHSNKFGSSRARVNKSVKDILMDFESAFSWVNTCINRTLK